MIQETWRTKEIIIRGGQNISPEEIEESIAETLNQDILFPAQFNKLYIFRPAVAQFKTIISGSNMPGRWAYWSFLFEKLIPFSLYDPGSRGVGSHRIGAHDQTTIAPRILWAEVVGTNTMKQGC